MSRTELNKKIAEWLGWQFHYTESHQAITYEWYITPKGREILPDFYGTSAAFCLLEALLDRGFTYKLLGAKGNIYIELIEGKFFAPSVVVERQPTVPAAICEAVLRLADLGQKTASVLVKAEKEPCNCCARAGEYNGFGSDGPLLFHCDLPNGCACHD